MEIDVRAILAQMLNFGLLTAVLTYFLLKPMKSVLEARSRRIAEGQKAADEALAEKARIGEIKTKAEKDAKQEAKNILATARQEAETRKEELMTVAKTEVETAKSKMLKNLDKEKAAEVQAWQKQFEAIVLEVSEQLVGESLDSKKHAKLIDQGLQRIASSK